MTNTLGGGANFSHFMDHLGPALQGWLGDMEKHKFDFSPQQVDSVKDKVNDWVSQLDLKEIEANRDEALGKFVEDQQH